MPKLHLTSSRLWIFQILWEISHIKIDKIFAGLDVKSCHSICVRFCHPTLWWRTQFFSDIHFKILDRGIIVAQYSNPQFRIALDASQKLKEAQRKEISSEITQEKNESCNRDYQRLSLLFSFNRHLPLFLEKNQNRKRILFPFSSSNPFFKSFQGRGGSG